MFLISKVSIMTDQGGNDHRDVTSKQSKDHSGWHTRSQGGGNLRMIDPLTGKDVGCTFVQPHDRIKNTEPHVVPVHATLGILPGNLTLGSNPPYADDDSQATKSIAMHPRHRR